MTGPGKRLRRQMVAFLIPESGHLGGTFRFRRAEITNNLALFFAFSSSCCVHRFYFVQAVERGGKRRYKGFSGDTPSVVFLGVSYVLDGNVLGCAIENGFGRNQIGWLISLVLRLARGLVVGVCREVYLRFGIFPP